jgi:class 3 adenylate cyclase
MGGRACPGCGLMAAHGAKFCPECGERLASARSPLGQRKLVTILFCDLVGSTAIGERLDPEAFRDVQLRYFAACERELRRHDGRIEKFIGDAVLCVFGTPVAREDDALRACRAALDLVRAVGALNDGLDADWGVRLAVRTGVNTGRVVTGDPADGQVLVSGDAVNTAARLEQAAGPGEVLIGPVTRELLGDNADCVPLPPLTLKGKAEPIQAWRLVAMTAGLAGVGTRGSSTRG